MKKSFLALASFAAIVAGCQVEPVTELPFVDDSVVYEAVTEAYAPVTKTAMDGLDVVWSEDDYLAIFQGNILADKFVVSEGVGETVAKFTLDTEGEDFTTMDFNLAVYPYADDLMVTPEWDNGVHMLPLVVPSVQEYAEGTFANGSFPMVAVTESVEDKAFAFKNVFGVMKLQLKGTKTVKSVIVSGANSEVLAGQFMVLIKDGIPSVTPGDYPKFTSVTVDCREGVELDSDIATDFYIALPPTKFEGGFTVTVVDVDNKQYNIKAAASDVNVIERSKILVMPEVDVDEIVSPVDFAAIPGMTDAELSITLNEEDAVGFYGIYSSAENWAGYSAMFAVPEYFEMLIGGEMASMGVPCNYYEGKSFTGNLVEFGFSEEYLDYGYVNMVAPGSASIVVIIPVYDGKDTYTLNDAIIYEVRTSELTMGGTVALPEYEIVPDYTTVAVNFEPSSHIVYALYGFFGEDEALPTPDTCLEDLWLEPYPTDNGGFSMETSLDYGDLPGTSYTLCIMVADAEGNAELHVIENVATKPIPYDNSLKVTVEDEYYDEIEQKVYAYVTSWPDNAVELWYAFNTSASYTDYNAATTIAPILNGAYTSFKKIDLSTIEDGEIDLSLAVAQNNYAAQKRYLHVLVKTADGKVSPITTSGLIEIPKLEAAAN